MLVEPLAQAIRWWSQRDPPVGRAGVSASRDVFQARLDSVLRMLLRKGATSDDAALLIAALGELGNNSFDHNLGQWRDVPGCWLGHDVGRNPSLFWIMDRGVGVLQTLRRVEPSIETAEEAVETAFARVLSGRAPERRGNGLKFVRSVINGNANRALVFQSGSGAAAFGGLRSDLDEAATALSAASAQGVAAIVAWRLAT